MDKFWDFITNTKHVGIVITILAALIYINTIPNKWAVDDVVVIQKNQLVQRGIAGIPDIFSQDFMYGSLGNNTDAVSGGRWRPLTPAMYAVFSEILAKPNTDVLTGKIQKDKYGNPLNDLSEKTTFPNVMHVLNILLYAFLCWVLYQFLILIFEHQKHRFLLAFLTALIFTVHPIHTEVVANVKGSDEILSLLFSLLAATVMFKAFRENYSNKISQIILSGVLFFNALLAKENSMMFMIIIPMTLWFFGKVKISNILSSTGALAVVFLIYFGLRTNAAGTINFKMEDKMDMMNNPFLIIDENTDFKPLLESSDVMVLQNPSFQSIHQMPFLDKLATNIYTFGKYIQLLILPVSLTYDYYPRYVTVKSFSDVEVWISLIVNLGLLIIAISGLRNKQVYSYGILFYFITFSITSNVFFPIGTNMGERFMFMPSVGILMAFSFLLLKLINRAGSKLVLSFVTIVSILFIGITFKRNFDWKDNFTLFSHDILISKNSAKVKSDFGEVVLENIYKKSIEVQQEQRELTDDEKTNQVNLLKETLPYYKEALDIYPMYGLVWFNLARTNKMLGDQESLDANQRLIYLKTAEAAYKITDTYKPIQYLKDLQTFKSLCYTSLGKLYGQNFGNLEKAIEYLQLAEKTDPKNSYAYFLLGTAYSIKGDSAKSFFYAQKAYNNQPESRDYQENYALSLQKNIFSGKLPQTELKNAEKLFLQVIKSVKSLPNESIEKEQCLKRNLGFLYDNYVAQNRKDEAGKILLQLQK
ncbi:tetratricopeptide repeat protein [Epilithonimonas sp. JDS]|uniref:tetratricopeptide repeat protein n=1 Tax=Epilithonimonas sp. JDS TaxID=2902797 RepID=UPI001E511D72|nr:tetratricopeptide repeat protein [Epilithonimonas sp. JDS]MCD9856714.1 tetratricopeptide repeat protein [Epilithonimonas sp. JDS]